MLCFSIEQVRFFLVEDFKKVTPIYDIGGLVVCEKKSREINKKLVKQK